MTDNDVDAWEDTLTELRRCRALDPELLGFVSLELVAAAAAAATVERGKVLLLAGRLLYVLQHEDGRGL